MMAAVTRSARTVKKLEKPRPLKIVSSQNRYSTIDGRISTVEDIMALADAVSSQLTNGNFDQLLQYNVIQLCANLKQYGQQIEAVYKDQLDRCFVAFRNGCRDEKVDYISRINLLEMIELRARNWVSSDDLNIYYRSKMNVIDPDVLPVPDASTLSLSPTVLGQTVISPVTPQPSLLNPGEVIKASGKFAKPTKIPGKNYCKDEVVIRNSDSGKVMGIKGRRVHMIEELSETIISFQRVNPGAKERLVQITGPNEEKINYAKHLMEDTIRRNASPVRLEPTEKERVGDSSSSLNSSASDESNRLTLGAGRNKLLHSFSTSDATLEYKYTVSVGDNTVKITGTNLDLVWTAKLVLDDFFNKLEHSPNLAEFEQFPELEVVSGSDTAQALQPGSSRVDGIDSGATSESEETYKAPIIAGAIPQSPSYEFGHSDLSTHMAITRQPLFPSSSKEAFHQAELSERASDIGARSRRAFFAQTNSQQQFSRSDSNIKTEDCTVQREMMYVYSHEQLLSFAMSELVRKQPPDWERISKEYPNIVNKIAEEFDPVTYSQKWHEIEVMTSVISATEIDPADIE